MYPFSQKIEAVQLFLKYAWTENWCRLYFSMVMYFQSKRQGSSSHRSLAPNQQLEGRS